MQKGKDKGKDKTSEHASWGTSLMLGLSAETRNRRKRHASKRRRKQEQQEISWQIESESSGD
jgi:hypothetical protein